MNNELTLLKGIIINRIENNKLFTPGNKIELEIYDSILFHLKCLEQLEKDYMNKSKENHEIKEQINKLYDAILVLIKGFKLLYNDELVNQTPDASLKEFIINLCCENTDDANRLKILEKEIIRYE